MRVYHRKVRVRIVMLARSRISSTGMRPPDVDDDRGVVHEISYSGRHSCPCDTESCSCKALARTLQAHPLLPYQTTQSTYRPATSSTTPTTLHLSRTSSTHRVVCFTDPASKILSVHDRRITIFTFRTMPCLLICPSLPCAAVLCFRYRPKSVQALLPVPAIWLCICIKYGRRK